MGYIGSRCFHFQCTILQSFISAFIHINTLVKTVRRDDFHKMNHITKNPERAPLLANSAIHQRIAFSKYPSNRFFFSEYSYSFICHIIIISQLSNDNSLSTFKFSNQKRYNVRHASRDTGTCGSRFSALKYKFPYSNTLLTTDGSKQDDHIKQQSILESFLQHITYNIPK